jgi:predicted RNase H-like nuclease (RuvC/YqgF family)
MHDIETNKSQIDLVKQRFSDIDDLQRKMMSLQSTVDFNAQRLSSLETVVQQEKEKSERLVERIAELEKHMKKTESLEKRIQDQDKQMSQIQRDFDQLRIDARDALTLAGTVTLFKNEVRPLS